MHSISTIRSIPLFRSTSVAAVAFVLLSLAAAFAGVAAGADKELLQLFVTEPYLELHAGPGRGYAVTQVVPRGDSIDVLYRRTDWFRVRTERGVEGWAHQRDMLKTLLADGTPFTLRPRRPRRLHLAPLGTGRVRAATTAAPR